MTLRRPWTSWSAGTAAAVAVLAAVGACASPGIPWAEMEERYRQASSVASGGTGPAPAAEVPVTGPEAAELVLRGEGPARELLVTTWVEGKRWRGPVGSRIALEEARWAVPAPRLRDFCRGIETGVAELHLRVEQLLGLPPRSGRDRRLVELWAPWAGIEPWMRGAGGSPSQPLVHPSGYTYDWGNPRTDTGLPLVRLPAGTTVEIATVEPLSRYCRSARAGR